MELKLAIEKRSSIRRFKNEAIPFDDLKEMVSLAGMAPSINNSQPWKFLAITNKELLKKMAEIVHSKIEKVFPVASEANEVKVRDTVDRFSTFFSDAPAVIAVLNQPYSSVADDMMGEGELTPRELNRLRNYPDIQSVGAAVQNLLLSAVDKNYGACWLSGLMIAKKELEELLKIDEPFSLVTCIAIGKPLGESKPKEKKSLDEIFELID
jgi:nitroreductase